MTKETFERFMTLLQVRIEKCELLLGGIKTTDDLKKLTIQEALELQNFCRAEESLQTKIVQCDLYHIIGMGELTPPQMMKFTYGIKEYLKYRSTIKTLAMNFDKISNLPGLPVSSFYKTHGFGGMSLSSVEAPEITSSDLPFAVSGELIQVLPERLPEFVDLWSKKAKVNISGDNMVAKAKNAAEYGGIRWTIDTLGNYVGVFKADNVRDMFTGIYKDAQENN